MIQVNIEPHTDGELAGKYDIKVYDGHNGELLLFSNQGYENRGDAEAIARRLFSIGIRGDEAPEFEHADLFVMNMDGTSSREMIR